MPGAHPMQLDISLTSWRLAWPTRRLSGHTALPWRRRWLCSSSLTCGALDRAECGVDRRQQRWRPPR
jgi:hypothetical protein